VDDQDRRAKVYVAPEIEYQTQTEIAVDMTRRMKAELPFEWALGDDQFGRSRAVRDQVWALEKSYVFDVPCDTRVRLVDGTKKWRADELARTRKIRKWRRLHMRDGEKGPLEVSALRLPVTVEREDAKRRVTREVPETLVVIENLEVNGKTTYHLRALAVVRGTPAGARGPWRPAALYRGDIRGSERRCVNLRTGFWCENSVHWGIRFPASR